MEILISIIIPVYGVEKYIERCANSLFSQTIKDKIEFLFINDCTQDQSIEILEKVIERYPDRKDQVRIIQHSKNKGLSSARKTGIEHANGLYIAHCDSDDWVEVDMYEKLLGKALENEYDFVGCDFFIERNNSSQPIHIAYSNREEYLKDVIGNKWGTVWRYISKRNFITNNKVKIIPEICHGEDYIYTSQLLLAVAKFSYLSEPLYHYNCENMDSMMRNHSLKSALQQKAASDFIFNILQENNLYDKYSLSIIERKLFTRNQFIGSGVSVWRSVYPELHNSYWKLKSISIKKKFAYLFLEKMPKAISQFVLRYLLKYSRT